MRARCGIAAPELGQDRVVLRLGAVHGAAIGHGPDDPRPLGAADQVLDQRGQRRVARSSGRSGCGSRCRRRGTPRRRCRWAATRSRPGRAPRRATPGPRRRWRSAASAALSASRIRRTPEQLRGVAGCRQLGQEAERAQQAAGVELGHVGAVALPGLQDTKVDERPDALAQRPARHPELGGELLLDRQPRAWAEHPVEDESLDLLDHHVGLRQRRRRGSFARRPGSHQTIVGIE